MSGTEEWIDVAQGRDEEFAIQVVSVELEDYLLETTQISRRLGKNVKEGFPGDRGLWRG